MSPLPAGMRRLWDWSSAGCRRAGRGESVRRRSGSIRAGPDYLQLGDRLFGATSSTSTPGVTALIRSGADSKCSTSNSPQVVSQETCPPTTWHPQHFNSTTENNSSRPKCFRRILWQNKRHAGPMQSCCLCQSQSLATQELWLIRPRHIWGWGGGRVVFTFSLWLGRLCSPSPDMLFNM